ncbi:LuxR C-terminal-related transcriptional regulator [Leifsonia shinshuensis]|uniref:ATP-binding protein n=1 Tax=Leifsonia shinshuensis TaxID=150026 RepID=UPI0028666AE5|nr:LuxR C-terminal-related transcriptional regulator [Leifsonia shinshuensis]MDR6972309.1 DNA-binding CsgD family transcriptional regulator [Leifsonia shinshuensis]
MGTGSPPAGGVARVCPLFVGREDVMALVLRRRAEAAAGRGELLLVGGEAGIGKSRLLDEFVLQAGGRSVRADSFAGDRGTPGLLLLGIAAALREAEQVAAADRLRELVLRAADDAASEGARRILVAELAATLAEGLATPLLLRLEDLHWADQLSLDVLQRVTVSLPLVPSLVVASYRSEEPETSRDFTTWRLGLLAQRRAEEVVLERLDRDGTRRMLASIGGEEPAADEVDRLFDASDGIPLHVEELVAVGVDAVPDTIGEAVVVRMARLGENAALALAAAAVIGREFDRGSLGAVLGDDAGVDAALEELIAGNFVVPAGDGFDFRHALIRDAVYGSVPAARRRELHARVVGAVPQLSDAAMSRHFERAGRADEAYARARRAAGRAAALSAHREAVDLYRRAERTVPSGTLVAERAELHRLLGAELAATDANREAEREFSRAIELFHEAGDPVAAAAVVPALVAARHLLGAGYEARAATIEEALDWIAGVGATPVSERVRGRLLAADAAAAMLDRRLDLSLRLTEEARELLTDDPEESLAVDVTRGAVLVFAGAGEQGWELLEHSASVAAARGWEAAAARAYRMIGSSASVLLQYRRGRRWLEEGIAYATRIERWNDAHYLEAHLAHVEWATGSLDAAERRASRARADGRGGITTEVTALHVLGYVALSRGDTRRASDLLTEAAEIGERMNELQRLSPALWGLAEVALADGDAERAIELCEQGRRGSEAIQDAAYAFPYLVTGTRAHLLLGDVTGSRGWVERAAALVRSRGIPGTEYGIAHAEALVALAERRLSRAKELLAAAGDGWDRVDRWWEGTQALLDRAECARRTRGPAEAAALVDAARVRAEAAGAEALIARGDALTRRLARGAETSVLSSREHEVARLVAAGATNREIGESLHIAPKTVATHVEHILAKLGAARRTEIAAWAVEEARRGSAR